MARSQKDIHALILLAMKPAAIYFASGPQIRKRCQASFATYESFHAEMDELVSAGLVTRGKHVPSEMRRTYQLTEAGTIRRAKYREDQLQGRPFSHA